MTMYPKHFLLIDDLDPKPVVELLSKIYPNAQIQRLRDKEAVQKHLQDCPPKGTVILLNAHIRFNDGDLRSNFLGMRFLRQELRTKWRLQEAVVVYSPLDPEVFLNIPINRILCVSGSHRYYQIIKLRSILDIIDQIQPIESDIELDEIIERYGGLVGLIRTFRHDLGGETRRFQGYMKEVLPKVGWEVFQSESASRLENIQRLVDELATLIPRRFHSQFQTEQLKADAQGLVEKVKQREEKESAEHAASIPSILDSYPSLCEQRFTSGK